MTYYSPHSWNKLLDSLKIASLENVLIVTVFTLCINLFYCLILCGVFLYFVSHLYCDVFMFGIGLLILDFLHFLSNGLFGCVLERLFLMYSFTHNLASFLDVFTLATFFFFIPDT